jgi:hypothetical protein
MGVRLNRNQLADVFREHDTLRAFEQALYDVDITLPSTIEEANALAGAALAVAQMATAALSALVDSLSMLEGAPAAPPVAEADDMTPRVHLGTMSTQNEDSVAITGGTIDGTAIGQTTAAVARVTDLTATGKFGCNGKAAQPSVASGGTVATTGATNASPYGFTTAAQANDIVTKLNTVINALVANGTLS